MAHHPSSSRATRRAKPMLAVAMIGLLALSAWRGSEVVTIAADTTRLAPTTAPTTFPATALPTLLSQTGLFTDLPHLTPVDGLIPYDVNVPFWSDGAGKRRWIKLPPGSTVRPAADDSSWRLPAGTTLVKHFEFAPAPAGDADGRLETRVLVVGPGGAIDLATYRWRPDHGDADRVDVTFTDSVAGPWQYLAPADCRTCHTPQAGGVLGINTRQLSGGQLVAWHDRGLLPADVDPPALPRLPRLDDTAVPIETRARSWLDANCAQCHRPGAAAADLDLRFSTPLDRQGLLNARPRIDLGIDGARMIAPNDPWRSLVLRRMETIDGNRMPPLAHHRVDEQGRALLREWIAGLPGPSVLAPPTIDAPPGGVTVPLTITLRHPDPAATIRYTLDGSAPRASSPIYEGPIRLDRPTTVRARAFRDGYTRSIVIQQTFTRSAD